MDNIELLKRYYVSHPKEYLKVSETLNKPLIDTDGLPLELNTDRYFDGYSFRRIKKNESIKIVKTDYDAVYQFGIFNLVTVVKKNGKYGIINYLNQIVIPIDNDMIRWNSDRFFVMKDGICKEYYFELYSIKPYLIKEYNYLDMKIGSTFCRLVKNESGWGVIERDFDKEYEQIIPNMYADIESYSYCIFLAKEFDTNKWMIIDKHNEPIINEKYDRLKVFKGGKIISTIGNKEGLIDENLDVVIPNAYPNDSIKFESNSYAMHSYDDHICVKTHPMNLIFKPEYGLRYQNVELWFNSYNERKEYINNIKKANVKTLKKG